jgi:carotenoid cleavage dioxygenase
LLRQEFPWINETLPGGRHRFGYAVCMDGGYLTGGANSNVHRAVQARLCDRNQHGYPLNQDLLIGEMSFVPNPMGYGYQRGRDEGQLVLPDAQSLESVATVHLRSGYRWAFTATGRRPANAGLDTC